MLSLPKITTKQGQGHNGLPFSPLMTILAAAASTVTVMFVSNSILQTLYNRRARRQLKEDARQGKELQVPPPKTCPFYTYSRFSLVPLIEALQFLTGYRRYVSKRVQQYGCPIFRGHPGVETVLVTDHTSVKAAFAMGPDQLDRDGTVAFGPIQVHYEQMLRGCIPALMTDQKRHARRRQLMDDILAVPSTQARFVQVAQDFLQNKSWPVFQQHHQGSGNAPTKLTDATFHAASHFVMQWLFDIEGAPGDKISQWTEESMGLRSDRWVANWLGNKIKPPPSREMQDWSEAEMQRIEASEPFQNYYRDIGAKLGFRPEETAAHLLWACHFNATGGIYGTLFPTICMMETQPEMKQKLVEEQELNPIVTQSSNQVNKTSVVEGQDNNDADSNDNDNDDITQELDKLPYLNAFCNESMRFFGRPKHYYRKAKQDIVLPTSDGKRVAISKGTVLALVSFTARQDPTVFPGPEDFSPQRYLDHPHLEQDLFSMGPPSGNPGAVYNCAAAHGRWAIRAFKICFASFLQKHGSYTLEPPHPIIDIDAKVGVSDKQTILLKL